MANRPEFGVHLRDAAPLVAAIKTLLVERSTLVNPEEALPRPNRVTVYLSNHGPLLTPFPAPALTVDYLLERGGYEDLVAITLFHRVVEFVPGLSSLLRRFFGHSTPSLRSVAGLTEIMKERRVQILGTAPEGRSCVYSFDAPVGPFTKLGLIVASLEADADIVLTAQKGLEHFGRHIRLPVRARLPIPGGPRGLQLPLWYPGRRAHITLGYRRYVPLITAEERGRLDPRLRRAQLQDEFAAIHRELTALYLSLS